jgi:hypothetical protein
VTISKNILGKVGGGEMEFGGVNVHALDLGENTVCFSGISNAFYEHLHVKICKIIPKNIPYVQHSHCVKYYRLILKVEPLWLTES